MLDYLKGALALLRMAKALERIANAQEEQVKLARADRSGSGFYSGYSAPDSVVGSVLSQSDEDFARLEEIEAKRARGEFVSEEEEGA